MFVPRGRSPRRSATPRTRRLSERPTGAGARVISTTLRLVRLRPRKYTVKADRTAAQKQRTNVQIGLEGNRWGLLAYAGGASAELEDEISASSRIRGFA
jgi:hypothetical protein